MFRWCVSVRDLRECVLFYVQSVRLTLVIWVFSSVAEIAAKTYIVLPWIVGSRSITNINVVIGDGTMIACRAISWR